MSKKLLSIVGSGRSGSTLLTLLLGSHPKCFSLGELNKLYRYHRKDQNLCGICKMKCDFWDVEFSESEISNLASALGKTRLHPLVPFKVDKIVRRMLCKDQVFNPYSLIFSKLPNNIDILIDSSKDVSWVKERLEAKEFTSGRLENKD
jgi:hypothetical protein